MSLLSNVAIELVNLPVGESGAFLRCPKLNGFAVILWYRARSIKDEFVGLHMIVRTSFDLHLIALSVRSLPTRFVFENIELFKLFLFENC